MSLWLKRKDKDGKTYLLRVPLAPLVILPLFGVLVAVLLPLIQAINARVNESKPITSSPNRW